MDLPNLARVRQQIPQPRVEDVPGTVRRLILESRIRDRVPAGGTVAVGVGSRGITGIATIARAAVDALKEMGYKPFIVAAMGCHGGATREGQAELLAGYGVTAETMGVPVKTDMDTVVLGTNPVGLPIYFDRNAHEADGIVLLEPGQAAHRLPRDPRIRHPQDADDRPGQARRRQPGPQAGPPRAQGSAPGRRPVPGEEHQVRPRRGDHRERPRRDGRARSVGAGDALR